MAARLTAYVVVAIVAATLIAGLIVGAQRDDNDGPVDLIVRNASVYTADRRGTVAESVAVRGNQILRVGTDREIARLQRPQTLVIDAKGGAVLPGLNDAHVDLVGGGLRLLEANVSDAADAAGVLDALRAWAEAHPAAPWVIGTGWTARQFEAGGPTRQLLDSVVRERPAVVRGTVDGMPAVWVNSAALQRAGVGKRRGSESGGVLRGSAAAAMLALVPPPSREHRALALRAAVMAAAARGITSVHNVGSSCEPDLDLFEALEDAGDLTLRIACSAAVAAESITTEQDLAPYEALRTRFPDDPFFKVAALTFAVDGPVSERAAALLEPYAGGEPSAEPAVGADALNRAVRLADAAGWQVVTRAHGDAAVRMALNAYAHAIRSNRPPARGRRHRIERMALVDAADGPRFGTLGVLASVQPGAGADEEVRTRLARELGAARARRTFSISPLSSSPRLLLGSGWPPAPLDPWRVLDMVVNSSPDAADPDAVPLTAKQAIDAYTSGAAWGSFDDQRKGALATGMLADLVVLSDDVLESPEKLGSTTVVATIFDGRIVYRAGGAAELTSPSPEVRP